MRSLAAMLSLAGCSSDTTFTCQDDQACNGVGPVGQCEPNGFCSFADSTCDGGRRYGTLAGDGLAGMCINPAGATEGPPGTTETGAPTPSDEDPSDPDDTGLPSESWWDCRWAARRRLTIEPSGLDEVLSGVPVLIVLDDTRIDPSIMTTTGRDLRFVTADDTELPYEIEQWSPSGLSWVWLYLPQLEPAGTSIDMYYGEPGAIAIEGSAVWDQYLGVWHMGAGLADATGFNQLDDAQTTDTTIGQIASAQQFDDNDDGIRSLPSRLLGDMFVRGGTVSAMVRAMSWGASGRGVIVAQGDDVTGDDGWALMLDDELEALRFGRGFTDDTGTWYSAEGSMSLYTWHHVAVVYDDFGASMDREPVFYIDGVLQRTEPSEPPDGEPESFYDEFLFFGGDLGSSWRWFDGLIDEVRLAPVPRSAGWMAVQAASMRDDLVTYGPPQSSPCDEPSP